MWFIKGMTVGTVLSNRLFNLNRLADCANANELPIENETKA